MHKLLTRQLAKLSLSEETAPTLAGWQDLLAHINRSYQENDQERYLLERSMEISSRELGELNRKLEAAQQIANLGYWLHDLQTGENAWSKELYTMFKLALEKPAPDIPAIFELVHPEDKDLLQKSVDNALASGQPYDVEIRMKNFEPNSAYRWYHIVAHPDHKTKNSYSRLFGIAKDIQFKKTSEQELANLNQQLISSARRAGMAEVATVVLHNIGNVLNSANVSVHLLNETITQNFYQKLFAAQDILDTHAPELEKFLKQDEQALALIEYLNELIKKIRPLHALCYDEVQSLMRSIGHIKDITNLQQSISGKSSLIENFLLTDILRDAEQLVHKQAQKQKIKITKTINKAIELRSDKTKLLQILVNILQNAIEATVEQQPAVKEISITVTKYMQNVSISIRDNGIGMSANTLSKLFTFGFSTKPKGHGYGLHSSALNAKELGGELVAQSTGIGKGTEFILTIPTQQPVTIKTMDEASYEDTHY